jgi:hypothetical protein
MNISPVLAFVSTANSVITTTVERTIRTSLSNVLASELITTTGIRRRSTTPEAATIRANLLTKVPEKI